jgi:YHS domain-containing protein
MRTWIRALLAAMLVAGFGLAFTFTSSAADKEPPKKDEKKGDGKDKPAAGAEEKKKDPKDMTSDEREAAQLCIVDPTHKGAKPVYHADYKDKTYHFCSRDCQKAFAADPAKYIKEAPAAKK